MKTHYSIADLLDLNLEILPKSRKGLGKLIARQQWEYREVTSRGKGGTRREYILPNEVFELIVLKKGNNEDLSQRNYELPILEPDEIQNANDLMHWQIEVAENRLFIVRYIQNKIRDGYRKTIVIEHFIADAQDKALPVEMLETIKKANAKAGDDRTVSRRSIFDWLAAVENAEAYKSNVLVALAPKPRIVNEFPIWADALLKLWGQPQKPTLASCLELLPNYLSPKVECPSYSQAYRFLNEKMGKVELQKGRMGAREIKNIKGFIRRDTTSLIPTDVYTADGHCFDAEIAHPKHGKAFRPEITSIIDVATRRIVGWSIDLSENTWAVLDAIRMSAMDCGIPSIFYVDNGSGYKNAVLTGNGKGILSRLNVKVLHALPYNSQAKGLIERSHQTIWVKAAKRLPSYIGKDMDAEAQNKVFKASRKEIIQFGQAKSIMKWTDFIDFAELVVFEYNNKPHKSLKRIVDKKTNKSRHMTPVEAWESFNQEYDRIEDWDAENFFRPTEERTVKRCEIMLFNNRYFHKELEQYHDENVLVGYDIHNAEQITVRDLEGRLICKAIWNGNKRDYFPKSVIEQAREQRALGRMQRLKVKQDEVLQEVSPPRVIEHIENQNVIPFNMSRHQQLMAEMEAIPEAVNKEVVSLKTNLIEIEDQEQSLDLTPAERWVEIDMQIFNGESVGEEDKNFWNQFQLSKKFKQLSEEDETLKMHLERRHG